MCGSQTQRALGGWERSGDGTIVGGFGLVEGAVFRLLFFFFCDCFGFLVLFVWKAGSFGAWGGSEWAVMGRRTFDIWVSFAVCVFLFVCHRDSFFLADFLL